MAKAQRIAINIFTANAIAALLATVTSHTLQAAHGAPMSSAPVDSKPKMTAKQLIEMPPDGFGLCRMRRYPDSLKWAEQRLKITPKDMDVLFLKARMEHVLGLYPASIESCTRLIKAKAHPGASYRMRADCYNRLGDYTSALRDANDAVKVLPYEDGAMGLRKKIYSQLRNWDAMDRDESKRLILSDLRNAWDRVLEKSFEEVRPNPMRKTTYQQEYSAGLKAFTRLSFLSAVDYFTRVIKVKPDWLEAYLFRAQSLETLDRWSEAIPDLTYIISKGDNAVIPVHVVPDSATIPTQKWEVINLPMGEAHKRRARCYAALRKYQEAIADMDVAVKQEPEDRWTRELRGNINSSYKKYKDAISDYERAEKLDPAYLNCGPKIVECCTAMGNYETAVTRLTWMIKSTPSDDVLLMQRADCLSKLKFHKEAVSDLTAILDTDDEYIEAYLRRGREYESLGNLKNALDDYTKAMNLDKGSTQKSERAFAGRDRVLKEMKGARATNNSPTSTSTTTTKNAPR